MVNSKISQYTNLVRIFLDLDVGICEGLVLYIDIKELASYLEIDGFKNSNLLRLFCNSRRVWLIS